MADVDSAEDAAISDAYFNTFLEDFDVKHGIWEKEDNKPQTGQEYKESFERRQTNVCTRLASIHYSKKHEGDGTLMKVTGIDSHAFPCKWVYADDDQFCFHVNFSARDSSNKKRFFFPELTGYNDPLSLLFVRRCEMLGGGNGLELDNCKFCTGLWHPLGGDFLGHK